MLGHVDLELLICLVRNLVPIFDPFSFDGAGADGDLIQRQSVLKVFKRGEIISIALPSDVLARSKDLVISAFRRSQGIMTVIILALGFLGLLQL